MNPFVFGLATRPQHFVRLHRKRFERVAGTVRDPGKAAGFQAEGVEIRVFSSETADARIAEDLAVADLLLCSIAPGHGRDPALAAFATAIAAARQLRWIGYLSTIGVYGDHDGAWVDETTPPRDPDEGSRARLAAEADWLALGRRLGAPAQVFRLGGIYGPGRNALAQLAAGRARRVVKPGQVFNRIHVEDIARVLQASIKRPRQGAIYNVVDNAPSPAQESVAYAAELLGIEPPPEVPLAEADLSPMARSFYAENRRVRNDLIRQELGVSLRYPTFREGLSGLACSGRRASARSPARARPRGGSRSGRNG
jgi:nucleoside-diphosphate-sugar epimerase